MYRIQCTLLLLFCSSLNMAIAQNADAVLLSEFIYQEAPFPSCHASTLAETPEGMVAAWFGGTHEKHEDVGIWFSRRTDHKWTPPMEVANGVQHKDKRYPCWNPVLFQVPSGPLLLFYKVGPNPEEWWGMMMQSEDNGQHWSEPRRLPEDILGPVKNKPVLINDQLWCPSSKEPEKWEVFLEMTPDWGKTWSLIGPVPHDPELEAIQPSILYHPDGRLQILCRSKNKYILESWSTDRGQSWSPLQPTSLPNPNAGTDAVTLKDGRQLLIYNHQLRKNDRYAGSRSPLNVAISEDGKKWKAALILEDQPGEYSYPAVIQSSDGKVHITYTWKREKIKYVVLDPNQLDREKLSMWDWPE